MSAAEGSGGTGAIGLFSSLTGAGSRELVRAVLSAMASGGLGGARPAFLAVNRGPGESAETDASAALLAAAFPDLPILRTSAKAFQSERRLGARRAGDEAALADWRDAYYAAELAPRLPAADLDLLLGDMWIWGPRQCAQRPGVNLHPSLPTGPLGKMWFDVVWDLIGAGARESGVMLHRVIPAVDEGPVVSFCRYALRGDGLDALWREVEAAAPGAIAQERALRRASRHPLFLALRERGYARELPLILETIRAVADGRLSLGAGGGSDGGLDLTAEVERRVHGGLGQAGGEI